MKRIGILGGTFNPIHIGHLAIAQTVYEKLKLDAVVFVPSNLPPHKSSVGVADAKHRLMMAQLAVKKYPHFRVSDFEVKKEGKSYSIDTVRYFMQKNSSADKFFFIIGQDSLPTLNTWKDIAQLRRMVDFVVVNRAGVKSDEGNVKVRSLSMPALEISSSEIRQRIAQGKTARYLLPDGVEDYIRKHHLYS